MEQQLSHTASPRAPRHVVGPSGGYGQPISGFGPLLNLPYDKIFWNILELQKMNFL